MFKEIIFPIIIMAGLGLIFGIGLLWASKKFFVKQDPRIAEIEEALPSANCGACGYPGCSALAEAIAEGKASTGACPVGGPDTAKKIACIMGVEDEGNTRMVARVMCQGDNEHSKREFAYNGIESCHSGAQLMNGPKGCRYGCLGLGTCEKVCPFGAIKVNDKHIAVVDEEKCTGCGKCVEACPRDLIAMVPENQIVTVLCSSRDKGKYVKDNCSIGCIGCHICEKACQFDAIVFEGDLPKIDFSKCTSCMVCAEKCPTNAIFAQFEERKTAVINEEKCIGCTACKRVCKFDAIEGNVKEPHVVDAEKCTGCGECFEKCKFDAITMLKANELIKE